MTLHCLLTTGFVLAVISTSLPLTAQLTSPSGKLTHQFSRIAGAVELPDGRVIIADSRERMLHVGDLSRDAVTQLGRNGAGPAEYRGVFGLVRSPGDTILSYDPANNRLLKISPKGEIAGSLAYSAGVVSGGLAAPKAVDAQGRVYWDRVVLSPGRNGLPTRATHYQVVRWRPGAESAEVVATPADHAPSRHEQVFHPFAERDDWGVDAGGRVVVLEASRYGVRFFGAGAASHEGPTLTFTAVPVTTGERDAFRREMAVRPRGAVSFKTSSPRDEPSPTLLNRMRADYPDAFFPPVKPPFAEGALRISPGGELWVVRSTATGERRAPVDILGATGARRASLVLPANTRLVALEKSGVYLAREDDDGFEVLERYPWPRGRR